MMEPTNWWRSTYIDAVDGSEKVWCESSVPREVRTAHMSLDESTRGKLYRLYRETNSEWREES